MLEYSFSINELEYFLLILVRMTSFIHAAPFFGMNNTPARAKISIGFFLAMLLYHTSVPHSELVYYSVWGYAVLVLKEAICGLILGFGAHICTTVVTFSGTIIDMNIGMSMVSMLDPTTRQQSSISGTYLQYVTMLILLVSGMYQFLISALVDSYHLIPIGHMLLPGEGIVKAISDFMVNYIVIGFRICLPVFAAIMILNCVLGIMAKVAPQINMFAVGIQIKLLLGLTTIALTTVLLPGAADFIFSNMRSLVYAFMEQMY